MKRGPTFGMGGSTNNGPTHGDSMGNGGRCIKPDCLPQLGKPCGWCAQK